jgi:hypothetical protein
MNDERKFENAVALCILFFLLNFFFSLPPSPPYIGIGYAAVGVMIEMFTSWQSAEGLVNVPPSEAELKAIALAAETV